MRLRRDPGRTGFFFDFDGTLSEIVSRPELASPYPGIPRLLRELAARHAVVAVVSGRTKEQIRQLLPATSVAVFGLYGLEEESELPVSQALRREAEAVAATVAGAWVEDKGPSFAVHYRSSPNPEEAERILRGELAELAITHGRTLLLGKMVLELAPASTPGKGSVVVREALARGLVACLYAGDDVADLEGFSALDQLREGGILTVKVAVRSLETPLALLDAADLVVDGPRGLAEVLRRL